MVGARVDVHPQRRPAFWCLFFALTVIAFATSCDNDSGGGAPVVEQIAATAAPATTIPTPAHEVSPTETGATLVLVRHDEPRRVNHGANYVYGELSLSGECLRISYIDPSRDPWTQDGLLLVWPAGFDVRTEGGGDSDDVVKVTGDDGDVVAAVGQTLRVSGKHTSDRFAVVDEWDWAGGEVGHCTGPYWLVGDEVTAMRAGATGSVVDDDIFLPRLYDQRGSLQYTEAAAEGRLTLRGRCLLLGIAYPPGEYLVIWPPGFNIQREGDDVLVRNGGGNVIAQVGDHVMLAGRSSKKGADYPGECPGAYFKAYTVQRSPAR